MQIVAHECHFLEIVLCRGWIALHLQENIILRTKLERAFALAGVAGSLLSPC